MEKKSDGRKGAKHDHVLFKLFKEENKYLNIYELSDYIKRSPGSIRNMVMRSQIPFKKPAGRLFFIKSEIDKWIEMS